MLKIVTVKSTSDTEVKKILNRGLNFHANVGPVVLKILSDVRRNGHKAVVKYAAKYDGVKGGIKVSGSELKSQAANCPLEVKKAVNLSLKNVQTFHKKQREASWQMKAGGGSLLGQDIRPLQRVGMYIPGGAGVYPSTVIMNGVPARVAGVKELVAVTPSGTRINPAVAYALVKLKVNEVYRVGGAHSIAMLAYGTEKCKQVDKIVGPGNNYVAAAKKEVFGTVDIDMVAGPSEILILADDSADPDWVAADLLSQAEHGSGDEAAILVTTSKKLAVFVNECIRLQIQKSPKKELLKKCLKKYGRTFVVKDLKSGWELANAIAPEHMELMLNNNQKAAAHIKNAGALFMGPYSSEPLGDYLAGPNHVLPTSGSARFFSPLGVYDFYKRSSIIQYTEKSAKAVGKQVIALAEAEGFIHHAEAMRKRL